MDYEEKQVIIRKICNSKGSDLVVLSLEVICASIEEIKQGREILENLKRVEAFLNSLQQALDFQYDLAKDLFSLYQYEKELLARFKIQRKEEILDEMIKVLMPLKEGFEKVACEDTSEPLMQHSQQIYAGMTYGKYDLNESIDKNDSRGFLV